MATIVVEDGTLVANANSYSSEAELSTFATDRGITIVGTAAVLLIQAMDYLEQQNFIGIKYTEDQALQWPRYGAYIDSYLLEVTDIPNNLKNAQMQIALSIDAGYDPLSIATQKVKKEKVDVIEVEYADSSTRDYDPKIANYLKKLIQGGGAFRVVKA